MKLALFASLAILASCHVSAQTAQNVTPHDSQPIQPVIVTTDPTGACTNYALTYINWKTGAQTVCANGNYLTSQTGGGGGIPYPPAGVALSGGTSWNTSKPAPSGDFVGTSDTQTLTNKTVDGASPSAIANIANTTSDVQTQLNSKISSVGIQQNGTAVGTAQILNLSTNLNATVSGGVATITASGSGGGGGPFGYFATAASNTSTLTVGTDCTSGTPCVVRVGSFSLPKITASMTATAATGSGTNDTAFVYIDPVSDQVTIADTGTVTLSTPGSGAGSGMVVGGTTSGFPVNCLPLFQVTIQSNNFTAVTDVRAGQAIGKRIIAGTNVSLTETVDAITVNATGGGSSFNGGTITTPMVINDSTASFIPLTIKSANAGLTGFTIDNTNASSSWTWAAGADGTAWFQRDTPNSAELYLNATTHVTTVGDLQLSPNILPTCDSTKIGTFAWDGTAKKPEVCDGTAWHHLTYSD